MSLGNELLDIVLHLLIKRFRTISKTLSTKTKPKKQIKLHLGIACYSLYLCQKSLTCFKKWSNLEY